MDLQEFISTYHPKVKNLYEDIIFPIDNEEQDELINKLFSEGHEIIINTCRSGKYEGDAEDFLIKHGIHFNQINSNLPHVIEFYGRDTRKISADLYIDNKQLGGLPLRKGYVCWRSIYHTIKDSIKRDFKIGSSELSTSIRIIEKNYELELMH
jgi:hypothetical protein